MPSLSVANRKIKVLHISSRADMGGGPKHIQSIIKYTADSFEHYIASPDFGFFYSWFVDHTIDHFSLPHRSFSIRKLIGLIVTIKKWNIDLIHTHGRGAGVWGRLASLFLRVPIIHTHHGFINSRQGWLIQNLYFIMERLLNRLTNIIVFVSNSELEQCRIVNCLPINKSYIIPNGVPLPVTPQKLQLTANFFKIITITRLEHEKGNLDLIRLAHHLSKKRSNFLISIVGDGVQRNVLENLVDQLNLTNFVRFLGVREDTASLLSDSDIFITCSHGEAQGIAVLEAMSHRLPVVATNVIGHIDTIRHLYNGLLFDLNDPAAGSDAIAMIMDDPKLKNFVASNARKTVEDLYTLELMISRIKHLYKITANEN